MLLRYTNGIQLVEHVKCYKVNVLHCDFFGIYLYYTPTEPKPYLQAKRKKKQNFILKNSVPFG